jgi:hypothetical protein
MQLSYSLQQHWFAPLSFERAARRHLADGEAGNWHAEALSSRDLGYGRCVIAQMCSQVA